MRVNSPMRLPGRGRCPFIKRPQIQVQQRIAFYLFLFVVVTSYFRPQLRYRPWKKLHDTAYAAAAVMYVHGTLIDPNLKDLPTDFLDGEKVQVELCFLLVLGASVWR